MFTVTLFIRLKDRNNTAAHQQINGLKKKIATCAKMEYYSTIQENNKVLIHATQMNLLNTILGERARNKRDNAMRPFICYMHNRQIHRDIKQITG